MSEQVPAYGLWSLVVINSVVFILFGFLFQWPTLLTLAMFPVLVWMYLRLARQEEREAITQFGDSYRRYMAVVPGFMPRRAGISLMVPSSSRPGSPHFRTCRARPTALSTCGRKASARLAGLRDRAA